MPQVTFKRGTTEELKQTELQDGLLSFTTDDGKIHLDFLNNNNELERKTFYSGKLFFGDQVFDGSKDVTVEVYKGESNE